MKKYAIIVAGGSGSRMKSDVPKQFMLLHGTPVLMHTLKAFAAIDVAIEIILTLPAAEVERWNTLCNDFHFTIPHHVVGGGDTRYGSVKNALDTITDIEGLVAVHDGVRPLISSEVIENAYSQAEKHGSAVVAVALKDSIRKLDLNGRNTHQDRTIYRLVQTPQAFLLTHLKAAYAKDFQENFTDDASVYEANGGKINLIEGEYSNLKITTPEDLLIAEALLKKEK